ncbi:hypothetical protein ACJ41O_003132 [Fusarium nematophilum]
MLRYLRHKHEQQYLWIDAICLNQKDEVEKSIQVPAMGEIYREAETVIVWLGEDDGNDAVELFSFMREYAAIPDNLTPRETLDREVGLLRKLSHGMLIHRLFRKHWFFRRWTIQEAALSQNCIVLWGEQSIPLSVLQAASTRLRARVSNEDRYSTEMILQLPSSSRGLMDLLWMFHRSECLDPRDRIAAFYGLIHAEERLAIDYRRHWWEIYLQHAKHQVQLTSARNYMLHLFCFGSISARFNDNKFPSWVPDWSRERRLDLPYLDWSRDTEGQHLDEVRIRRGRSSSTGPNFFGEIGLEYRDGGLLLEWRDLTGGYYGRRVSEVYRHAGSEVSTIAEVKSALRPLLESRRMRRWARGLIPGKPGGPSRLSVLIATMLRFTGAVASMRRCNGNAELEVELYARQVDSCFLTLSGRPQPQLGRIPRVNNKNDQRQPRLMKDICDLLQRYSLFEVETQGDGSLPEWGIGHRSVERGDLLIPVWSPPWMMPDRLWYMNNGFAEFFITAALREQARLRCDRVGAADESGRPAAGMPPLRGRYVGSAFCIMDLKPSDDTPLGMPVVVDGPPDSPPACRIHIT